VLTALSILSNQYTNYMSAKLNKEAFEYAKKLIKEGKVDTSDDKWSEHNPNATQENKFLQKHEIEDYSKWHLGIDTGEDEENKGRYKFPFGDFKKVYRSGLVAVKQRAAQNHYPDIEKAAGELLELLNK